MPFSMNAISTSSRRTPSRRRVQEERHPRNRIPQYLLGAATASVALTPQCSEAATVTFSNSGSISVTGSPSVSPFIVALPDSTTLTIQENNYGLNFATGAWLTAGSGQFAQSAGVNHVVAVTKTYPIPDVLAPSTLISTSPVTLISPATFSSDFGAYATTGTTPLGGFTSSFSNQYIGFKTSSGNNAYLDVSWDVGTKTLSWNGGAVETSGGALSTPSGVTPVPEATGQSGLLALLVTGAVNQIARRRTQRSKAV
jgi:hypothetical protein